MRIWIVTMSSLVAIATLISWFTVGTVGTLLSISDYDAAGEGNSVRGSWQAEQEPAGSGSTGVVQAGRIAIVSDVPGVGVAKPTGNALRVELRRGENAYGGSRAEVYGRHAVPGDTPAELWPDPVGAIRWYGFSLLVPTDHVFASDATWLTLSQWKGRDGAGPPIALELQRDHLRLGGTRGNSGVFSGGEDLGVVVPGSWTRLVVGMKLSPDPRTGWVEAWRDGNRVVSRTAVGTLDYASDGVTPDPIYFKQGIYRSPDWLVTHVLWFGPVRIGTTLAVVGA